MKSLKNEDIYKELSALHLVDNNSYTIVFNDYGDSYIPEYLGTEEDRTYLPDYETGNIGTISIGVYNDEVTIMVAKDSDGKNRKRYEFLVRSLKTMFGNDIKPTTAEKRDGEYSTCVRYVIPGISLRLSELINRGFFEESGFNIITEMSELQRDFDHFVDNVSKGYLDEEPLPDEPIISHRR